VSGNVIEASWKAMEDAYNTGLRMAEVPEVEHSA
jgi:hypothetical protein